MVVEREGGVRGGGVEVAVLRGRLRQSSVSDSSFVARVVLHKIFVVIVWLRYFVWTYSPWNGACVLI